MPSVAAPPGKGSSRSGTGHIHAKHSKRVVFPVPFSPIKRDHCTGRPSSSVRSSTCRPPKQRTLSISRDEKYTAEDAFTSYLHLMGDLPPEFQDVASRETPYYLPGRIYGGSTSHGLLEGLGKLGLGGTLGRRYSGLGGSGIGAYWGVRPFNTLPWYPLLLIIVSSPDPSDGTTLPPTLLRNNPHPWYREVGLWLTW